MPIPTVSDATQTISENEFNTRSKFFYEMISSLYLEQKNVPVKNLTRTINDSLYNERNNKVNK